MIWGIAEKCIGIRKQSEVGMGKKRELESEVEVQKAIVLAGLRYGCESWVLGGKGKCSLQATPMSVLKQYTGTNS